MDSARRTVTPEGSTLGFAGGRETCQEGGDDPVHGVRLGDHLPSSGAGDNIGDKRIDAPEGARLIPLTRGYFAIVDEADFALVSQWRWAVRVPDRNRSPRAFRMTKTRGERRNVVIQMHRFLMDAPPDMQVDHINGNGLDNRRCNLRLCTGAENARNRRAAARNKTGIKGVLKRGKRFRAQVIHKGRTYFLGNYNTPEEAGLAYDRAATRLFGEFARLNFPECVSHVADPADGEKACIGSKGANP